MTKQTPTSIDVLLATATRPRIGAARSSVVANNGPLARAVREFLELKAAGDKRVIGLSLSWFYREKLQVKFGGPAWFGTVRKYVREYLQVDINTGKPL